MVGASGIGTYLNNVIPRIISLCPDIQFNLLGDKSYLQDCDWVNDPNVSLLECNSPIYSVTEQIELCRKIPPSDIFWSPHYNIPLFSPRAKKRLVTIHDVNHLVFFDSLNLQQKIYAKAMLNLAARRSEKIITVSNFSKSEIMKYTKAGADKITVIHNGINTDTFKILEKERIVHVKKKLGLPDRFILFVGNVKPHKNLKILLRAFETLCEKHLRGYKLVIAGKKEGFITGDSEIFNTINSNPALREHVLFTGHVDNSDLPAIYNAASLFVFPSLYEGFGLPPLEAMASGCPSVVSKIDSLSEICGDGAYYVDPYDDKSIADGIHTTLADNTARQALIHKVFMRIKMFNWDESANKHVTMINELLHAN
jgi:glycosyltransferase involved in cell wall biosynthesis